MVMVESKFHKKIIFRIIISFMIYDAVDEFPHRSIFHCCCKYLAISIEKF